MPKQFIRPYIHNLTPYSTARDDFSGVARVYLDANENPFPSAVNRYPDPQQRALKARIAELKGLPSECIFLGNGSDEAIDLILRLSTSAETGVSIITPSYGMYKVSARNNNIAVRELRLNPDFSLNMEAISKASARGSSLLFICSPNNPTGNLYTLEEIEEVLRRFHGLLVVDEAYIDFAGTESALTLLPRYDRLIVLQTFSKAWGLAGIRLGLACASSEIIQAMNKLKLPYNLSTLCQQFALEQLSEPERMQQQVQEIISERLRLSSALSALPIVEKVYPSFGNFLLFKVADPQSTFRFLQDRGVILRDRSRETLCEGCLRLSIGTREENELALEALREFNSDNMNYIPY